ncbi:MAG: DUF5662 family protein [Patescibacteria group bacterium]
MEKHTSYKKYALYISEHIGLIRFVANKFSQLMAKTEYKTLWEEIRILFELNIYNHDSSKYSDEEFYSYRKKFFPEAGEKTDSEEFNLALLHHYRVNPHHWEYWIIPKNDKNLALQMPHEYLFEMLCDWTALSLKFGDYPSEFYNKNKERMILHEETIQDIEKMIKIFDQIVITERAENELQKKL